MKLEAFLLNLLPLAHGYGQLKLALPSYEKAAPGHFVWLEEGHVCYILSQDEKVIELITDPVCTERLRGKATLKISSLQGAPLPAPLPSHRTLFIAQDNAIAASLFYFKQYRSAFRGMAFIGTSGKFPFFPSPSQHIIKGVPPYVIAALPLLEDWGIPHRLASEAPLPGCFEGPASLLAKHWLQYLSQTITRKELQEVVINYLPPHPKIAALASSPEILLA